MIYSYNRYTTEEERCTNTKYNSRLMGAFYDCYTLDGDSHFYRSAIDKPSLLARREFYRTYFSKRPYPVFSAPLRLDVVQGVPGLVLFQVLGLPEEARTKQGKDGPIPLSIDEILSNIVFDPTLSHNREEAPVKKDSSELYENDYWVIEGRNYLISKGIYCLHPELILDPEEVPYPFYPIVVLEDLLPERIKKRKPTADSLIRRFAHVGSALSLSAYREYYLPLNKRSWNELFSLAFGNEGSNNGAENPVLRQRNKSLRAYLSGVRGNIRNGFFQSYDRLSSIGLFTVLDTDLGFSFTDAKHRTCGTMFNRYGGEEKRTISVSEGKKRLIAEPVSYFFLKKDRERIGQRFDFIFSYRKRHPDKGFVPSVFLKRMGMPYECLPFVRYFDFSSGDTEGFLSLLPFKAKIFTPNHCKSFLPFATPEGTLVINATKEELYINHETDLHLRKRGINYYEFFMDDDSDGIIQRKDCPEFNLIKKGGHELFSDCYQVQKVGKNEEKYLTLASKWTSFFAEKQKNGVLPLIPLVYQDRAKGYTIKEALNRLGRKSEQEKNLVLFGIFDQIFNYSPRKGKGSFPALNSPVSYDAESFRLYVEGSEYPYLTVTPFCFLYSKDGKEYFADEDEAKVFSSFQGEKSVSFGLYNLPSPISDRILRPAYRFREKTSYLPYDRNGLIKTKKGLFRQTLPFLLPVLADDFSLLGTVRQSFALEDGVLLFASGREKYQGFFFSWQNLSTGIKEALDPTMSIMASGFNEFAYLMNQNWEGTRQLSQKQGMVSPSEFRLGAPIRETSDYLSLVTYSLQRKYWRKARGFPFDQFYFGSIAFEDTKVAIGSFFYAFEQKDSSLALPLKDKDALAFLYQVLKDKLRNSFPQKQWRDRLRTERLGLPYSLFKPVYQALSQGKNPIDSLSFLPLNVDTSDYPTFFTPFLALRSQLTAVPLRTETRRRLLHRGRVLIPDNLVPFSWYRKHKLFSEQDRKMVYISSSPTGFVKNYFLPDELTRNALVKKFFEKYPGPNALYYQERRNYGLRKDRRILLNLRNAFSDSDKAAIRERKKIFDGFSLKDIAAVTLSERYDFVFRFNIFVLTRLLIALADEAIKEKTERNKTIKSL